MASTSSSSGARTPKKLIMDDAVSTLVTAKTTVIPRSSRSTSRLTNILERLSDDRPLSSSATFTKDSFSGSQSVNGRPPSKASLIIQAARRRDTDSQTSVSIEPNLDIEFITREEISAIQKDREDLEQLLQTSLNSAVKMKEKHDAVVQENIELKEALDILESENGLLKEQVNELKDMMRELRQLQKEQLMVSTTHRTFGGGSRMTNGKNGNALNDNIGILRMSDLSPDHHDGLSVEDPHHDDEENAQQLDKLALMFQRLNDACDLSSSSNNNGASAMHLIEQNSSLNKALKQMSRQSKELVHFDRECRGHESKLVFDIRALAEQAVSLLVETEATHATMKELFDTVEFAPKEEVDPYKINVKVQEREKRRRRPGSNSNGSSTTENQEPDFIFGTPSDRYPVSPARGKHVTDGFADSEHRLDEHPDEDKSDSEEEKNAKSSKVSSRYVDAIQEEEEDDEEDSLAEEAYKNRNYSKNIGEDDENEDDHRQRRRLRFADEQDRDEGEQPLDQPDEEHENHNSKHMPYEHIDEGEEEEEMTEEEYQYYLRLEQEQLQQEEDENRRRRELERTQNDD